MTSEAAQKAYPDSQYGVFHDFSHGDLLEAFDAGAVEALRQAAKALHAANMPQAGWLVEGMTDGWAGQ